MRFAAGSCRPRARRLRLRRDGRSYSTGEKSSRTSSLGRLGAFHKERQIPTTRSERRTVIGAQPGPGSAIFSTAQADSRLADFKQCGPKQKVAISENEALLNL
jgi:hypothetical protein